MYSPAFFVHSRVKHWIAYDVCTYYCLLTHLVKPWHYSCSTHCEVTLLWGVLYDGNNQVIVVSEEDIHVYTYVRFKMLEIKLQCTVKMYLGKHFYIAMTYLHPPKVALYPIAVRDYWPHPQPHLLQLAPTLPPTDPLDHLLVGDPELLPGVQQGSQHRCLGVGVDHRSGPWRWNGVWSMGFCE